MSFIHLAEFTTIDCSLPIIMVEWIQMTTDYCIVLSVAAYTCAIGHYHRMLLLYGCSSSTHLHMDWCTSCTPGAIDEVSLINISATCKLAHSTRHKLLQV